MNPLTRILAATDLSAFARHAVDRGFLLAHATHAHYTIMHALSLGTLDIIKEFLGERTPEVQASIIEHAKHALTELGSDPQRTHNIQADLVVAKRPALAAIADQCQILPADLLVIGAKGEGFMSHLLIGSTASRLLRQSPCPVLVVRQAPHEAYQRVLISVDFSPASQSSVALVRQIAPDAEIVLIHVFEVPFEGQMLRAGVEQETIQRYRNTTRQRALTQLTELAQAADIPNDHYRCLVKRGNATHHILLEEQAQGCDLIVMGKHGQSAMQDLLLGSVTKHVLSEAQGDVLIVTDPQRPELA